jgi:preprotein translocase SecF subunit
MVTIVTLAHDVLAALGFYLITSFFFPEFKVDTFFITAMLTVLGYSVSDTIVIMDRIRSNLKQKLNKKMDFGTLINNSINETLARSLFTSFTIFITLLAMFFF